MSFFHKDPYSHYRFGLFGESVACMLLWCKGYRILARRMRNYGGEIDIVAKRGRLIVFVEVKSRSCNEQFAYALPARQRKIITRAAEFYLQAHPEYQEMDVRFDVIYMAPFAWPVHLEDAW